MPVRFVRLARWLDLRLDLALPKYIKIDNMIMFGVVVPPSVFLRRGVPRCYEGLGNEIHRHVLIGDRLAIGTGVTIGGRSGVLGAPAIDQSAMIGSGAKRSDRAGSAAISSLARMLLWFQAL